MDTDHDGEDDAHYFVVMMCVSSHDRSQSTPSYLIRYNSKMNTPWIGDSHATTVNDNCTGTARLLPRW